MSIPLEKIQQLREQTMAPVNEVKKALEEAGGDEKNALLILRKKGKVVADKKATRLTKAGIITPYIHRDGMIGVLIELRSETDFVAKTPEFQALARDLAMHIAAMKPEYVKPEDIPAAVVAQERQLYKAQADESNKKGNIAEQMVEGKLKKYYDDVCLLNQYFVKDGEKTVKDMLTEYVARFGENIEVSKFVRFEI